MTLLSSPFKTTQPSQVKSLGGYYLDPLFTVGDAIDTYVPPGILHGIGAYTLNSTTVRLLVSHQISAADGYKYSLDNGTQISGSRISYFDIDKSTYSIIGSGLAYNTIRNRNGEIVDAASDLEFSGLQNFGSTALFQPNSFGTNIGLSDRILFCGETTFGGTQFALDIQANVLHALPFFGRAAWTNVAELNTSRTDKVAFLIGDDRGPAPLYLYIGNKNATNDGSFLDRNGLGSGKLYVWVADDPTNATDLIEADPRDFKGTNNTTVGRFVAIKHYDPALTNTAVDGPDPDFSIQNELGYDAQGFATQAQQDKLAADVKAFLFARPQDLSVNPNDGTQVVFAAKGRSTIFGGTDTYGSTYKLDIDFNNINTGDISARIDILFDGNVTKDLSLRNPDNLHWAEDGNVYISEDRADTQTIFAGTSNQEASVWRINPSNANPSSTLTRIAQIDRTALPATQTDSSPSDIGNWETTGILDVSSLFGSDPGSRLILNVQAPSLLNGTIISATNIDGNGDGTKTRQENLVQGGQLLFLVVNNPPTATDATFTINEGSSKSFNVTDFGFNDVDGQTLQSIKITQLPVAGTLQLNGNNVTLDQVITAQNIPGLAFAPAANGSGTAYANFKFTVNDGADDSVSENAITFNVTAKTYTFTASVSTVFEGNPLNIGVATTGVAAGTTLYWQASGPNITASDFTSGGLSGDVVIGNDGGASFSRTLAADPLVDPDEVIDLKFYSDASRIQQVGATLSITIKEPTVGVPTDGNDIITGTAAGEFISGIPVGSNLRGRGSRDTLTGGSGNDIFALGHRTGIYYDDGQNASRGTTDLAIIKDFSAGDRIQLWGNRKQYSLVPSFVRGVRGVRIDFNPAARGALAETIGFVEAASISSLNLCKDSQFIYLN